MSITNRYMFDTSAFNALLHQNLSSRLHGRVIVTGIQADELRATPNTETREALLYVYEEIKPISLLSSSFAFDIEGAGLDQAYWNDGGGRFEKMLNRLQELEGKKKDPRNQLRDILIAETALKNDAVLVSNDANLRQVMEEFGGRAITVAEACKLMAYGTLLVS